MILIGWFNITNHIRFGKKGKSVYIIVLFIAPLGIIISLVGSMNPDFTASMIISMIFLGGLIFLMIYIITGFLNKPKQNKDLNET